MGRGSRGVQAVPNSRGGREFGMGREACIALRCPTCMAVYAMHTQACVLRDAQAGGREVAHGRTCCVRACVRVCGVRACVRVCGVRACVVRALLRGGLLSPTADVVAGISSSPTADVARLSLSPFVRKALPQRGRRRLHRFFFAATTTTTTTTTIHVPQSTPIQPP
jgi:hypothetical protein